MMFGHSGPADIQMVDDLLGQHVAVKSDLAIGAVLSEMDSEVAGLEPKLARARPLTQGKLQDEPVDRTRLGRT